MLKIGSIIDGKYRVLHKIGKGGMSIVYLCINEKANKQWAVKEVRKNGNASSEVIRQNLLTETSILKKLHHPHLPSIIDVIDQDDTYLILMDYVEGRTLKAILDERGALPQEKVVDWAIQLASTLMYLHRQDPPIIYRDMKPANVMLKPDGNVVLIDFGTAREYKDDSDGDTTCLGTKGYAAPEQYGGKGQTDARTDVYNLGATMYQLVTGKNPTKPPYEIRPIRQWNPALSSGLESIIVKCTKSDPDERYQSVAELKFALEHYREFETEYISKKKKSVKLFITMCVLSGVMFAGSLGTHLYSKALVSGTYDERIRQAQVTADTEEKIKNYEYAIRLAPRRETAYMELLQDVFLEDGSFTQEEADEMTRVLGYTDASGTRAAEEKFSGNPEGYDEFCYQMGLAYFYYYDETGNKPLSKPWFAVAKDSSTLSKEKVERAKKFYQIADYYTQLNVYNKAGDNAVSYKDYWNDLVMISAGDIAKDDNIRTALVVYKELTYQIGAHTMEFKNSGVSRKDMQDELDMVSEEIDNLVKSKNYDKENDGKIVDEIRSNTKVAENAFATVFADTSNREERGEE